MAMLIFPAALEMGEGEGSEALASQLNIHFPRQDAQKENLAKQPGPPKEVETPQLLTVLPPRPPA